MNIVARLHLYPPYHCAGAERMTHELLKALVQRGHDVEIHLSRMLPTERPYAIDGIKIIPRRGEASPVPAWQDAAKKADVLITHLDNTSTVISAAIAYDKPLIQVLHNTHPATRMWASCRNDLLVYNSDAMRVELGDHPNGIVVHPPVWAAEYVTTNPERHLAGKVTLINLNQAKGGLMFAMLAASMPNTQFLGVLGAYGEQLIPDLPNVEIRPHGIDMASVYHETSILLMPSSYESYGRVGVEALASGIPVLAAGHPGVREALGMAGLYLHPDDGLDLWAERLRYLLTTPEVYFACSELSYARAAELDPTDELAAFCDRVEAL